MKPKEKALELVHQYDLMQTYIEGFSFKDAKQCALIAVDEAIRVCPFIDEKIRETEEQLSAFEFQFVSYWQQVKTEITKLL